MYLVGSDQSLLTLGTLLVEFILLPDTIVILGLQRSNAFLYVMKPHFGSLQNGLGLR